MPDRAAQTGPLRRSMWWLRDEQNPVLPPSEAGYDSGCCMNPWVVPWGDTYRLYYAGADADGFRRICMATASIRNPLQWTRHGVVLDHGSEGKFDYKWVVLPHVVRFGDTWHLYYTGNRGHGQGLSAFAGIGVATSEDGTHFARYVANPVIKAGSEPFDPDCQGVAGGSVIQARLPDGGSEWRLYYTGFPTLGDDVFLDQQKLVCWAVSEDGFTWRKRGAIMFRNPAHDYVNIAAAGPVVWQEEDGSFRMLLSAIGMRWGHYSICYAESDDGVSWRTGEHYGDDLTLGPAGDGWDRQMVEYPSVVSENGRLRLFYCGNGYGRTGIGTAVEAPLRACATVGPSMLRILAPQVDAEWSLRLPEGLSCDEGVFKTDPYPLVDWRGPNGVGTMWYEWETNDDDFRLISGYERADEFGFVFRQGVQLRAMVAYAEHGLDLKLTVKNTSLEVVHNVCGICCLSRPSRSFEDPELSRTYIVTASGATCLRDIHMDGRVPIRARYPVKDRSPIRFAAQAFWGEPQETECVEGAIVRRSVGGKHVVGMAWEQTAEIWENHDAWHRCIHANCALGDIGPGETRSVRGRLVFVQASVENAFEILRGRF